MNKSSQVRSAEGAADNKLPCACQAASAAPASEHFAEVLGATIAVHLFCNKQNILRKGCRRSCRQQTSIWADLCSCTAQSECASCKCFRSLHFGDKQFNQSINQSNNQLITFPVFRTYQGSLNRQYLGKQHTMSTECSRHQRTKHQRNCCSAAVVSYKHAMMLQRVHVTCNLSLILCPALFPHVFFPVLSPILFPTLSPILFPTLSPILSPILFPILSPNLFPILPRILSPILLRILSPVLSAVLHQQSFSRKVCGPAGNNDQLERL